MTNRLMGTICALFLILTSNISTFAMDHHQGEGLKALSEGDHRSQQNIGRNEFRNPVETLEFFGLTPNMTVVEISPGGGWYTEILAPFVRDQGKLYAASYDPSVSDGRARSIRMIHEKFHANPEIYSKVTLNVFDKGAYDMAPIGSADMVLTFRNLHNWMTGMYDRDALAAIFNTLKPGGVLGFVDHRGDPKKEFKELLGTGYVNQDYIINLAKEVGFEFEGSIEINANLKDTKDHPEGVWTLPPTFRLKELDHDKYKAIGESDRMTLKFRKPE